MFYKITLKQHEQVFAMTIEYINHLIQFLLFKSELQIESVSHFFRKK